MEIELTPEKLKPIVKPIVKEIILDMIKKGKIELKPLIQKDFGEKLIEKSQDLSYPENFTDYFERKLEETKDRIVKEIKDDFKLFLEWIDKRFEEINRRFEMMEKANQERFEMMEKINQERFEEINRRFEEINHRFEIMEKTNQQRFEILDKKFEFNKWLIIVGFSFLTLVMSLLNFLGK